METKGERKKQIHKFCENLKLILEFHQTRDLAEADKWVSKKIKGTFGSDVIQGNDTSVAFLAIEGRMKRNLKKSSIENYSFQRW